MPVRQGAEAGVTANYFPDMHAAIATAEDSGAAVPDCVKQSAERTDRW